MPEQHPWNSLAAELTSFCSSDSWPTIGGYMPYANLKISASPSSETIGQLARALTDLTARILQKKRELTSVAIECIAPAHWTVGGITSAEKQLSTFFLEVNVTEGTNTREEKAAYVEAVFKAMASALGAVNPASYIVVNDIPADAWGYGGRTQESRHIEARNV